MLSYYIISTYVIKWPQLSCWHKVCRFPGGMVAESLQLDDVNVLASKADWPWPQALNDIFRPRGVNLLVAASADDFVNTLRHRRIHTTIVDSDPGAAGGGLGTLKIIRIEHPLMPCIVLASEVSEAMLSEALRLEVFSVIHKPVDLQILREQLNRLFVKKYGSHLFSV